MAVEHGYGVNEDLKHIEENGSMHGGDSSKVSPLAKQRGVPQLGTLGAGNHFLEIQKVSNIFDTKTANSWGITGKDQIMIMLHCGSRGLGHQVASDYLKIQEKAVEKYKIWLPDRQLVGAPVNSSEGQDFFAAMVCAVNYSFVNRLVMTQWIRETFERVFSRDWESMGMHTLWSLCHNVVKKEVHIVDGKKKELIIHRKGATRAFPDQPVLLAGSMGTASYIMKGTEIAMQKTFGSSAHGAGRAMSRHGALHDFRGNEVQRELAAKGIIAKAPSLKSLAEEATEAYKDVHEVVESIHGSGISLKVVRVEPVGVLKG